MLFVCHCSQWVISGRAKRACMLVMRKHEVDAANTNKYKCQMNECQCRLCLFVVCFVFSRCGVQSGPVPVGFDRVGGYSSVKTALRRHVVSQFANPDNASRLGVQPTTGNVMRKCANAQMLKCTNARMHECTNAQMLKCSNAQMHK